MKKIILLFIPLLCSCDTFGVPSNRTSRLGKNRTLTVLNYQYEFKETEGNEIYFSETRQYESGLVDLEIMNCYDSYIKYHEFMGVSYCINYTKEVSI